MLQRRPPIRHSDRRRPIAGEFRARSLEAGSRLRIAWELRSVLLPADNTGAVSMPLRRAILWSLIPLLAPTRAPADPQIHPAVAPSVNRAVGYLRSAGAAGRDGASGIGAGEVALAAVALYKAGVPENDPTMRALMASIDKQFNGTQYKPSRSGGTDIYEAGVTAIALANISPRSNQSKIHAVASHIISKQKANGSWDYDGRQAGDTSISQYAILGLWEASNSGAARISPGVWDRAASWYLSVQAASGSWNYHRDEPSMWPDTVSMTAAGVGSLLICRQQLQLQGHRDQEWAPPSPLLIPAGKPGVRPPEKYVVKSGFAKIDQAVARGSAWIAGNFLPREGKDKSPFYGIYGLERVGSLLGQPQIGGVDWFDAGSQFLMSKQGGDGSWSADYGQVCNTAWALLFLTKSTGQSVERARRPNLGAGTLLGGRGLPKDLSSVTIASGRVVVRPMNGAIEGMLSVLEDPHALDAESAYAGLIAKYEEQGPEALRPLKDRLARLLREDSDPGIRAVAAWSLARAGDLDAVPALIEGLADEDANVRNQARDGLKLLSRKIDGYGPAPDAGPEERKAAQGRWREWYGRVRPARSGP